jgi:ribosomal-protein-serine acetyltransferase
VTVAAPPYALALPLEPELALRLRERHHAGDYFARLDASRDHLAGSFVWAAGIRRSDVESMVVAGLEQFARGDGWQVDLCYRGEAVGSLGLHHLDPPGGSTEVGFWLDRAFEGRGLMTRALRGLLPYFFHARGLAHVRLGMVPGRGRTEGIARRLTFQPEALLRSAYQSPAGVVDLAFWGLRKGGWREVDAVPPPIPRFALSVGEDLALVVLEREDAPALQRLIEIDRARLARYLPWAAQQELEQTRAFIGRRVLGSLVAADGLELGLWWRGALRGMVGIHSVRQMPKRGSLGYWVTPEVEGNGVVTRALRALIGKAFGDLAFTRLDIRAEPENARSRAVAERLGFRFEGVLPVAAGAREGYVDHAIYGMLAGEWGG